MSHKQHPSQDPDNCHYCSFENGYRQAVDDAAKVAEEFRGECCNCGEDQIQTAKAIRSLLDTGKDTSTP